jgi:hypothetical protein
MASCDCAGPGAVTHLMRSIRCLRRKDTGNSRIQRTMEKQFFQGSIDCREIRRLISAGAGVQKKGTKKSLRRTSNRLTYYECRRVCAWLEGKTVKTWCVTGAAGNAEKQERWPLMKKILAAVCSAAVILVLTGSAHAYRFDMAFDAGSDGLTITFTKRLLTQTIQLTGTEDPPQTLRIIPGFSVDLSLTSLGPDDKQQLTLHYALVNVFDPTDKHEGDITLPFEHGYITNRLFYDPGDPSINYDLQGSADVTMLSSGYSLQFGLANLNGLIEAQTDPATNDIHQKVNRDSGEPFADINLVCTPRLLYNSVEFNVTMTPHSDTGQWPYPYPTTFTGALPVPYGAYHFWFYRDSKN